MNPISQPDVIVIGGGPAGSTAASMLAKHGKSVMLLEREKFPREHVGESLLPASLPVLEELGVYEQVKAAGFLPKYGATMIWGEDKEPWTWRFEETNSRYTHSYQVNRAEFDNILLKHAESLGVKVSEESSVTEVDINFSEKKVKYIDSLGMQREVEAKFLIDASGQSALLSKLNGFQKYDPNFRNLAVYGYFGDAKRISSPNENNIFIESYKDGWMWNIPLKGGIASIGAVVDSEFGRKRLKALKPEDFLLEQISQCSDMPSLLKDSSFRGKTTVLRDWSYSSDKMAGDGWVIAGDAGCFIDPLFSSGVHLAMMSGVLAAAYANTFFKDNELALVSASEYERLFRVEYSHFRELALLFYSSNRTVESYFWDARRLLGEGRSYSPRSAFIKAVSGQPAKGYERAALQRGILPDDFVSAIDNQADAQSEKKRELDRIGERIIDHIPVIHPETKLEKRPVLGEGEFEWATVLTTADREESIPCSMMVQLVVRGSDGKRTVRQILQAISKFYGDLEYKQLVSPGIDTVRILYMDGAILRLDTT